MHRSSIRLLTSLLVILAVFATQAAFAQKDTLKKNAKASEEEQKRYEMDLKENPDRAGPHWRHANNIAGFDFQESEDAWKYYQKALDIDSTNAAIWTDYGDYLVKVLDEPADALYMYERAVELDPNNKGLTQKYTDLNAKVEARRATTRMRSIGFTDKRKIDHGLSYSVISNFDSLMNVVHEPNGRYNYQKQLVRFLNDDPLNEWETYLLCIGYSGTKDYAPYGDTNTPDLYDLNMQGKFDEVLARQTDILKKNPLSASVYRELMYALRKKGDNETADRFQRRAQRLYEAMIFTGDGTCEKPYVTLSTTEEYGLIGYMGFYFTGPQSLVNCAGSKADRMKVESETDSDAALYFNIGLIFAKMSELMKK